ncbi:AAA family ATPase [Metamycoplasma hominis]|uniref:AAA family ATPase n=1 Tax=Metamycoplasma hominis TaxID=2098 RepID=UPI00035F7EFA|nr:AAA family ATPase [Metamycoplasma hominis]AIU34020.1 ClpB related chaperone protein [Metamycoplasma hominis ATCC 27545]
MDFKNTINNQLSIKLKTKNILIIKGNTNDYIYPSLFDLKSIKKDDQNYSISEYLTLPEYLVTFLSKELNSDDIYYFTPSWKNLIIKKGKLLWDDKKEDQFSDEEETKKILTINDLIDTINDEISEEYSKEKNHPNRAYIIDFGDFEFNNKDYSNCGYDSIAKLISNFTSQIKQNNSNYFKNNLKLIIIASNNEIFNSIIFDKNPEVAYINIPKPDKKERELFLNTFADDFIFDSNNSLKNQKELENALIISEGLSFRELLQLARLSNKAFDNTIEDFKSLYRLAYFDQKESKWEKLSYETLESCDETFKKYVLGQDEAIEIIKNNLIRSFVGLQGLVQSHSENSTKPRGILFFAGPTGVGKTEIVKALSTLVFQDENKIIRFDMSEYNHEESDQKLIGSAPGYVGYEAGGQLTNAVMENPFSILLFDEIEKANGKILDKFLQILEDGRLTSSKGELVDFSETFIIFTSNIGSKNIEINRKKDKAELRKEYKEEVIKYFTEELKRPEILNRIGLKNIVPFNPITDQETCFKILKSKLDKTISRIRNSKKWNITPDNKETNLNMFKAIYENFEIKLGGRGLVMKFENYFIDELSKFIFRNYKKVEEARKNDKLLNIKYSVDKVSTSSKVRMDLEFKIV